MLHKIVFCFLMLLSCSAYADHLCTGEITYRPDPSGIPYSYEITVTIYTNISPGITGVQPLVVVNFGDNIYLPVQRSNGPLVNNLHMGEKVSSKLMKNIYITTHTYSGPGSYLISIAPATRNLGVVNLPSGLNYLYVASLLTISDKFPPISSPVLSLPPIGDGCIDQIYKINPGAVDADGDLLKFKLQNCQTAPSIFHNIGFDISGYQYPQDVDKTGHTSFSINPNTGTITWDKPTIQGEYNIAFRIEKWRNNLLIGYVTRDMQITIAPCDNKAPVIIVAPEACVEAGKQIKFEVKSFDSNNDTLTFTTTGSPYNLTNSPATFTLTGTNVGSTTGTFLWNTNFSQFRKNPYEVYYKVTDSHNGSSLADITSSFITILAPSVKNVKTSVYQRGYNVKWDQSVCPQAVGYNIYRKKGPPTTAFDSCTLGVPANSGFTLVGSVNSQTTLSFTDTNNGKGLASGYSFCYIVTAVFADGAESAPSEPSCSPLMYPFINLIQDTLTFCQEKTIQIDSTIIRFESTDSQTIYKWSSTPDLQIMHADSAFASVRLSNYGLHSIKIEAISGAYTDSARIYFNVIPIPYPHVALKDLGGMPDSVMFYNRSKISSHAEWLLPDGTRSSNLDSVMFVFSNNGNFRTYLKVYNSLDCPDTTSISYRVVLKGVSMPNAFEPENPNSEINSFRPRALGLQTYFLGIWDLWGNKIWNSDKLIDTKPAEGWNGSTSKGIKLQSQYYIWRMNATFIDGTDWKGVKDHFGKYHKEGTIFLLR